MGEGLRLKVLLREPQAEDTAPGLHAQPVASWAFLYCGLARRGAGVSLRMNLLPGVRPSTLSEETPL